MNKKQFLFLTILNFIAGGCICFCLGILLPKETALDKTMQVILSLGIGFLCGIILAIICIVFDKTRKD